MSQLPTLKTLDKQNILALSFDEILKLVQELGWKKYRADQIIAWIYKRHAAHLNEMTDLSKTDRQRLADVFTLSHLKIAAHQQSSDGTEKFLFALEDGKQIETVLIRSKKKRLTLCISSQAGCTLDCRFCLTAQEGLKRNLRTEEIIAQFLSVQARLPESEPITNVVLMGMGEPLANLKAVTEACVRLIAPQGLALSARRVTVSTAGLVPQMKKLLQGPAPVNLSISLNATTNATRDEIMPKINRLYPLDVLMEACKQLPLPPRRSITFEYVMLAGVNDSLEDASRLTRLTQGISCKINLIPFNAYPGSPYQATADEQILAFQNHLHRHKIRTTIRKSKGRDILAACGQLTSQFEQ
ncbi:MAG: 23S rRNA (adenine(2503)-C(2))-methyltransferase RlmN [Nitrospirota bacterium]|nr:23S rRNA (adenine(2503)-C(2))-methyltransferase RlmN [Nitrospirota bacterium]